MKAREARVIGECEMCRLAAHFAVVVIMFVITIRQENADK
jgi:hypothetical protein